MYILMSTLHQVYSHRAEAKQQHSKPARRAKTIHFERSYNVQIDGGRTVELDLLIETDDEVHAVEVKMKVDKDDVQELSEICKN